MVKLVDTPDLGSGAVRCVGSSPILGIFPNVLSEIIKRSDFSFPTLRYQVSMIRMSIFFLVGLMMSNLSTTSAEIVTQKTFDKSQAAKRFHGQVFIVTGASKGIGRGIANLFGNRSGGRTRARAPKRLRKKIRSPIFLLEKRNHQVF